MSTFDNEVTPDDPCFNLHRNNVDVCDLRQIICEKRIFQNTIRCGILTQLALLSTHHLHVAR